MSSEPPYLIEGDITSAFLDFIAQRSNEDILFHPNPHRWWPGERDDRPTPEWWALSNMSYRSDVDFFVDDKHPCSVANALEFVVNDELTRGVSSDELVAFIERVRSLIPERHVEYRALLTLFVFLIEDLSYTRFDEIRQAGEEVINGVLHDLEDCNDNQIWQARMWLKREAYLLSRFRQNERWNRFLELLELPHERLPGTMLMAMAQAAVAMQRHRETVDTTRRANVCSRLGHRLVEVAQGRPFGRESYHAHYEFEAAIKLFEAIHEDEDARDAWDAHLTYSRRFRDHALDDDELFQVAYSEQDRICRLLNELRSRRYSDTEQCARELLTEEDRRLSLSVEFMERSGRYEWNDSISHHEMDAFYDNVRGCDTGISRLHALACSVPYYTEDNLEALGHELLSGSPMRLFTRQIVGGDGRLIRQISPPRVGEEGAAEERNLQALSEGVWALRWGVCRQVSAFVAHSLDRLIEEELVVAQDVVDALREVDLVDDETAMLVLVGVEHLFRGDDIAALHILTPRFEDALRVFYHRVTLRGVRQRQGLDRNVMLGGMIDSDSALGSLPGHPDEWRHMATLWRYLLVQEGLGQNLRNDVCHGWWRNLENSRLDALLVLMCLLQLTLLDPNTAMPPENEEE